MYPAADEGAARARALRHCRMDFSAACPPSCGLPQCPEHASPQAAAGYMRSRADARANACKRKP